MNKIKKGLLGLSLVAVAILFLTVLANNSQLFTIKMILTHPIKVGIIRDVILLILVLTWPHCLRLLEHVFHWDIEITHALSKLQLPLILLIICIETMIWLNQLY